MADKEAYFSHLRVQGTVVGEPKRHSGLNRVTLRVATLSYGATFKEDEVKPRREVLNVELHHEAADKARLLVHGDVVMINNAQLVSRKWVDRRRKDHYRIMIMVDDPQALECVASGPESSMGNQEPEI